MEKIQNDDPNKTTSSWSHLEDIDWESIENDNSHQHLLFDYLASVASALEAGYSLEDNGAVSLLAAMNVAGMLLNTSNQQDPAEPSVAGGRRGGANNDPFAPDHYPTKPSEPNKAYLDDIVDPHEKLTMLAMHRKHCEQVKHTFNTKQAIQAIKLALKQQQGRNSTLMTLHTTDTAKDTTTDTTMHRLNRKRRRRHHHEHEEEDDKDEDCVQLYEPEVLRMSIYHKFVLQYQHFYNEQNASKLVNSLMLLCCSKDIIRQNKLWSKRTGKLAVLQDTTFVGLDSLEMIFRMIFHRVPDCTMVYDQSRIRPIPGVGTFVYTPLTLFCTVPVPEEALLISLGINKVNTNGSNGNADENKAETVIPKAPVFKTVELEATGWNVLLFDHNNRIVWRLDNFFVKRVIGIDPRICGEAVWHYLWKR